MGIFSAIKGLFAKEKGGFDKSQQADSVFAARFHRFKLFLNAHLDVSAAAMELEERLYDPMPYGMPFVRACASKLSMSVLQCLVHLNALSGGRYKKVSEPFDVLRAEINTLLVSAVVSVDGPLLLRLDEVQPEHVTPANPLLTPDLAEMSQISKLHPEYFSPGFALTAVAWNKFMAFNDLQIEIDRTVQISRDDPHLYEAACSAIRERILEAPLPAEIEAAILAELDEAYINLSSPEKALLVQCRPTLHEHAALLLPEQLIAYTPDRESAKNSCIKAFKNAMSFAFRPQSSIHRLKLGIRHRAMPFCVVFCNIASESARGEMSLRPLPVNNSDETKNLQELSPKKWHKVNLHVRRGFTDVTDNDKTKVKSESTSISPEFEEKLFQAGKQVTDIFKGDTSVFWALSREGNISFLSCPSCLRDKAIASSFGPDVSGVSAKALAGLHGQGGRSWSFSNSKLIGCANACKNVRGRVFLVRNLTDAINFPLGGILLMERCAQQWSFLLEFASAVVVKSGAPSGYFAATARLLQKPLFICDDPDGIAESLLALSTLPYVDIDFENKNFTEFVLSADDKEQTVEYLMSPHSPINGLAMHLAKLSLPVHLPLNPEDQNFSLANCKSYIDIAMYTRVKVMSEMFKYGTERKTARSSAKQLTTYVPKQFWVVDLHDGFKEPIEGQYVNINQIASAPLRELWYGIEAVPWDGPPPVDAKGFMSILFEATANPNLDPAQQGSVYTEKNYFMITKDYCNMSSRFGFHYLSLDALVGPRSTDNFVIFQFRGGAANKERRILRVHFISELLAPFGFHFDIVGDTLTSRIEGGSIEELLPKLRVVGYLVMHTRQLDMMMNNSVALAERRLKMMAHMQIIEKGEIPQP